VDRTTVVAGKDSGIQMATPVLLIRDEPREPNSWS
jgi:hypothetical protein